MRPGDRAGSRILRRPARTTGRDTGRYPGRIPRATARRAEALLDRSPAFVYHIIEQIQFTAHMFIYSHYLKLHTCHRASRSPQPTDLSLPVRTIKMYNEQSLTQQQTNKHLESDRIRLPDENSPY
jgi:hypothetical protein